MLIKKGPNVKTTPPFGGKGPSDKGSAKESDIGSPGPLDGPPPPDDSEPDGDEGPGDDAGYDSPEGKGAKLIADIEAAGEKIGVDGDTSQAFAADVLSAIADCLRGGGQQDAGAPPGMPLGPAGPPMPPPGRYGQ
jgi:hypothetical protein